MTKRPAVDLSALTAEAAAPMPEAAQRTTKSMPRIVSSVPAAETVAPPRPVKGAERQTPVYQPLTFKVSPEIRKRFRQAAANSGLKLNELLVEALEAWEAKNS